MKIKKVNDFKYLLPKFKVLNNEEHTVGKVIVEKNYKIELEKQITS
jgi:hypothetical protein